jgi:folate-binding protein YgfZ
MHASVVPLPGRAVVAVGGEDRVPFLQGLISNDATRAAPDRALYAALLTPQGKYLFDFLVFSDGERLLLDCEAERAEDLLRRLRPYRLRSKVVLDDAREAFRVVAVVGPDAARAAGLAGAPAGAAAPAGGGIAAVDPRHAGLGVRALLPAAEADGFAAALGVPTAGPEAWDEARLPLGVPDGVRDLVPESTILLEAGFDELNGVSWEKGCWMGQELTARTKYRGLVKRRLVPVRGTAPLPPPGTPLALEAADGSRDAGEMRSSRGGLGLAVVRLDALQAARSGAARLIAAGAPLEPVPPDWLRP